MLKQNEMVGEKEELKWRESDNIIKPGTAECRLRRSREDQEINCLIKFSVGY
jgi:hypothetical protein